MVRRFTIYAVSVVWGMFIVYFLLLKDKDRDLLGWLPSNRVKTKFLENSIEFSKLSECHFECLNLEKDRLQHLIEHAEVDFDASEVHEIPKKYRLKVQKLGIKHMVLSQFEDFAILDHVALNNNVECNCE